MIQEQKKIIEAQESEIQNIQLDIESQEKEKQIEAQFENERA